MKNDPGSNHISSVTHTHYLIWFVIQCDMSTSMDELRWLIELLQTEVDKRKTDTQGLAGIGLPLLSVLIPILVTIYVVLGYQNVLVLIILPILAIGIGLLYQYFQRNFRFIPNLSRGIIFLQTTRLTETQINLTGIITKVRNLQSTDPGKEEDEVWNQIIGELTSLRSQAYRGLDAN